MTLMNEAYNDIRQSIVKDWNQINFYNDVGELVFTKLIPDSTRIRWTHKTGRETVVTGYDLNGNTITSAIVVQNNPNMMLRAQVAGNELDNLPCTLTSVEIVNTNDKGSVKARYKETFDTPITFTIDADVLTYTLNLEVGE